MVKQMNINELQNELASRNINISARKISEIWGMDEASFSRKKRFGSEIKFENIKQLEKELNINLTNTENNISSNIDNCLTLPVLGEVSASLGTGIEVFNESQTGVYKISAKVLKDIGANPNQSDIIFAEGDSMEPTIQGGSALIVDKSRTEVKDGKIYCINFNGALMAKRLQLLPPKKIRIISDNFNKYPAWDVDLDKEINFNFKIVGEVMRWMTNAR